MTVRKQIYRFFASLKLAVVSLLTLSAVLAVATVLESMYGTRAAQVMVYSTWWFAGVLILLGLNVLCAATIRYPWKRHQTGFVVTHAGIIIILIGSWLTQQYGIDGNLPVEEGGQNNNVFLTGATLSVLEEDSKTEYIYKIPETGRARAGDILKVALPKNHKLVVDEFYPRAVFAESIEASPIAGGAPAVEIELKSSRFEMQQWMTLDNPDKPAEWALGPAKVTFQQLWTKRDEANFFRKPKKEVKKATQPYLVAYFQGREWRLPIKNGMKVERDAGEESVDIIIDKYFPHAVVDGQKLRNKSQKPENPAVQITVKTDTGTEKHTAFAKFPQFPTLHSALSKGIPSGIRFRLFTESPHENSQMALVGRGRGKLRLGQSADGKRLLYQVVNSKNVVTAKGEAKTGDSIQTGWMDIEFRINQWFPSAVKVTKPRYIDRIAGGDSNFASAIRLTLHGDRDTASTKGIWLLEGSGTSYSIDNRRYIVHYGRKKLALPFNIALQKFTIGKNPGTDKAASFASDVAVKGTHGETATTAKISMNEPLVHDGYTFYQASYQERPGQSYVSIFSVNWDPGRWIKYIGSLLLCLGILIMFYMNPHYFDKIQLGFLRGKRSS